MRKNVPDEVEGLVDYFANTYATGTYARVNGQNGNVVNMRRLPPRFPPQLWNCYQATIENGHRTNNMCEGFNNKFLKIVRYKHPKIWKFIEAIQDEEAAVRCLVHQDAIGEPTKKRAKKIYVQLQSRLKVLCE